MITCTLPTRQLKCRILKCHSCATMPRGGRARLILSNQSMNSVAWNLRGGVAAAERWLRVESRCKAYIVSRGELCASSETSSCWCECVP